MAELTHYSKNKEYAHYSDGSVAHRHKLTEKESAESLGAVQAYYLIIDGKCSKCSKELN